MMVSRLLIVDGDPIVVQVLQRLLQQPGRQIAIATTEEEALELAGRLLPEAALIDKNLAGESGMHLSRKLKNLQPEMEIIVTAGYASLETAIEAVRIGAFDYLTKPIEDYRQFAVRVQTAIDKSSLRRSQRALLDRLMESELRHRRLIEAVPDALIVHDAKTAQIQDANQAAVQLYGYSAQELMRLCAHHLGPSATGRQKHRRKDGGEFFADLSTTEYTQNQQVLRVMSVRPVSSSCETCGR